jgi:cobalt-precorrin 5A hydrolase / precorrin-3B C17-methyltransferase
MVMSTPVIPAPVFVVLSQAGLEVAEGARTILPGAEIHGLAHRITGADREFTATLEHLRGLFQAGTPIIGVFAAGILIRALGPILSDKRAEPPVLALAEDGSAVVPLLGGHHGANDLARRLADALGIEPAITTAGDINFGIALDEPPAGWTLANPADAKAFSAALLAGGAVRLEGNALWLKASRLPFSPNAELVLRVTERAETGSETQLVYHPPVLAVGVGCERGASPEEVLTLVRETLASAGLAEQSVAVLCSIDVKMNEPAIHAAASALGVPARFFDAARLEEEAPRLANPSDLVFREVGCHGVAEGAALAASSGTLIVPKAKSARATCAVGLSPMPLQADSIGRRRGRLSIVGIGPGSEGWRTPEADRWLSRATDLVGYHLYLDLLGDLAAGKQRHGYELGAEEMRVRVALDLAAEGREVALVSSGDAGIYAMATLVFELIDREDRPDWARLDIGVTPGISALQAAASRAGAPLGHDFCTISLSDLLTPWPVIERRIRAAAEGDFVIAVYNPVSKRRTEQLPAMKAVLLEHRPPGTPVILARNLGRPGETITVTTLAALDVADVDMLTLVMIGSSETRAMPRGDGGTWVYTPRGYAAKHLDDKTP